MRVVYVAAVVSVLLAGCSHDPPGPSLPPAAAVGDQVTVVQDVANDHPANYDVTNVALINLNGSLVVNLTLAGFQIAQGHRHPFYNVTLTVDRNEGGPAEVVAALLVDFNQPPPHIRPAIIVREGTQEDDWDACQATTGGEPAYFHHDLLHARSGLQGGGIVRHIEVLVHDGSGTTYDVVAEDITFVVPGGPNPYAPPNSSNPDADCPLLKDPSSPQFRGGD